MRLLDQGTAWGVPQVMNRKQLVSLLPPRLRGGLQSSPDALKAENAQLFISARIPIPAVRRHVGRNVSISLIGSQNHQLEWNHVFEVLIVGNAVRTL